MRTRFTDYRFVLALRHYDAHCKSVYLEVDKSGVLTVKPANSKNYKVISKYDWTFRINTELTYAEQKSETRVQCFPPLVCGLTGIITPEQEDDRSNESGVNMNKILLQPIDAPASEATSEDDWTQEGRNRLRGVQRFSVNLGKHLKSIKRFGHRIQRAVRTPYPGSCGGLKECIPSYDHKHDFGDVSHVDSSFNKTFYGKYCGHGCMGRRSIKRGELRQTTFSVTSDMNSALYTFRPEGATYQNPGASGECAYARTWWLTVSLPNQMKIVSTTATAMKFYFVMSGKEWREPSIRASRVVAAVTALASFSTSFVVNKDHPVPNMVSIQCSDDVGSFGTSPYTSLCCVVRAHTADEKNRIRETINTD
ncbi:hypothetical protein CLF_111170 [Clonorchis sinensis]|uniref:Uncharacterized protein n=1 Tax=Clonorchis sinensis TaxID=79923 RepID=G7YLG4_CLOSI|nr:hypothetical protein CLF_111170 [Clonorchis sinensis]